MTTIDAHQHFWQLTQPFDYRWLDAPALAPIKRDYLPEHLLPHLAATGVERSIFVQTQHNVEENRWALALAAQNTWLAGVVGWVDLASPRCEEQLLAFKDQPKFVGVRHVTQDEPDDDFILRDDVLRGLSVLEKHGVPFDLLFYVRHLPHAATLARRFPDLALVIDHLAKPQIKDRRLDNWLPHLAAAAQFPNVYCKLSGLATEADWNCWSAADLAPYVRAAVDLFGPNRCMYGSDWPVCELAGSYERIHAAILVALGQLSEAELSAIFGGTAAQVYGIE
jgi:L-fuconolactonase